MDIPLIWMLSNERDIRVQPMCLWYGILTVSDQSLDCRSRSKPRRAPGSTFDSRKHIHAQSRQLWPGHRAAPGLHGVKPTEPCLDIRIVFDWNSATFHVSGRPGDDKIGERHTVTQQELPFDSLASGQKCFSA